MRTFVSGSALPNHFLNIEFLGNASTVSNSFDVFENAPGGISSSARPFRWFEELFSGFESHAHHQL
jgi:hypothetical protein